MENFDPKKAYIPLMPLEEARELFFLEYGEREEEKEIEKPSKLSVWQRIVKNPLKILGGHFGDLSTNKEQVSTKEENEKKVVSKLSKQYVEQHTKCLNEVFRQFYRKTVMEGITIYSKLPLSELEVYAIAASYRYCGPTKTKPDFVDYLRWRYSSFYESMGIAERVREYEYIEDYLLVTLDVTFEELGFDPLVMKMTKSFNVKKDDGQYQSVIKAYVDFDIVVKADTALSMEEIKSVCREYRRCHRCVCEGEDDVSLYEFEKALNDIGFSRSIQAYEYHNGFLSIELK